MNVRSRASIILVQMRRALIAGMLLWGCRGMALAQTTTVVEVLATGASQLDGGAILPVGSTVAVFGISNFEIMVASGDWYGVYAATFDATYLNFASSTPYRLHWNLTNLAAGARTFVVQFGTGTVGSLCDFNSNYNRADLYSGGSVTGSGSSGGYYGIDLFADDTASVQIGPNGNSTGDMHFETVLGSSITWHTNSAMSFDTQSAGQTVYAAVAGSYKSGRPVTQICITGSNGYSGSPLDRSQKFSAHLEIWRSPSHK